jgi:hypothetical protein
MGNSYAVVAGDRGGQEAGGVLLLGRLGWAERGRRGQGKDWKQVYRWTQGSYIDSPLLPRNTPIRLHQSVGSKRG